jgi:Peptidase A4 family
MPENNQSSSRILILFLWIVFLIIVLFIVYFIFRRFYRNCKSTSCNTRRCKTRKRKPTHHEFDNIINNNSTNGVDIKTGNFSYQSYNRPNRPSMVNERSTNWCGYVTASSITTPAVNSCTYVTGTFIVPAIQRDVSSRNNNVSIWTGIDGAFATDPTVQQIGIDLSNVNGYTEAYAWFEMYPSGAYQIIGFPINVGDMIVAAIQFVSGSTYQLTLTNLTRSIRAVIPTSYTKSSVGKRQCVEWIVEAPFEEPIGILPLTHFNPIVFSNCTAIISNVNEGINRSTGDYNFAMVTPTNQTKAAASALTPNGSGFTVTWDHS